MCFTAAKLVRPGPTRPTPGYAAALFSSNTILCFPEWHAMEYIVLNEFPSSQAQYGYASSSREG